MVTAELKRPTAVDTHPKHAVALGAAAQHADLVTERVFVPVPETDERAATDGASWHRGAPDQAPPPQPPLRPLVESEPAGWGAGTGLVEEAPSREVQPARFKAGDAPPPLASARRPSKPTPTLRYGLLLLALLIAAVAGAAYVLQKPSAAGTQSNPARLSLTAPQVAIGSSYFAVASGYSPGENIRFTWIGPTTGDMGSFPADSKGSVVHGPIIERDPPGNYQIIVTGLTSGNVASAPLQVLPGAPAK
jgi:hypothetical protein